MEKREIKIGKRDSDEIIRLLTEISETLKERLGQDKLSAIDWNKWGRLMNDKPELPNRE